MSMLSRIGIGWIPGACIGVVSGFYMFNEPLREYHLRTTTTMPARTDEGAQK